MYDEKLIKSVKKTHVYFEVEMYDEYLIYKLQSVKKRMLISK